jgi:hypothetical protein
MRNIREAEVITNLAKFSWTIIKVGLQYMNWNKFIIILSLSYLHQSYKIKSPDFRFLVPRLQNNNVKHQTYGPS